MESNPLIPVQTMPSGTISPDKAIELRNENFERLRCAQELRNENLEQLRCAQELYKDGILTEQEYRDQKEKHFCVVSLRFPEKKVCWEPYLQLQALFAALQYSGVV